MIVLPFILSYFLCQAKQCLSLSCSYANDAVNLVKSAIFSVILKPFVVSFTYKLQSDTKENLMSIKDYFPYKLQGLVRGILIVGTLEEGKKKPTDTYTSYSKFCREGSFKALVPLIKEKRLWCHLVVLPLAMY